MLVLVMALSTPLNAAAFSAAKPKSGSFIAAEDAAAATADPARPTRRS
jgi:hypothetical protein